MPAIFDLLYREYCRARLAEMRKQLLISPDRPAEAFYDPTNTACTGPANEVSCDEATPTAPPAHRIGWKT
jgi:hypothetical protein